MANEQKEFWSTVAQKYDRVVDLQIGGKTRSMVREKVMKEGRLGELEELGCGTGFYTQALVAKADIVIATDIAPGMLAVAMERIKAANMFFQLEDCQGTSFQTRPLIPRSLAWLSISSSPQRHWRRCTAS